jgi:quercetin dioxygenase-like cupin family protein
MTTETSMAIENFSVGDLTADELSRMPQVKCPLTHYQPPGVYCRQIFMPAGTFVVGHVHNTEHINIVIQGKARVLMDGVVHEIEAPFNFVSKKGVRKVLYILEDMIWMTVHPTKEKNLEKLLPKLININASTDATDQEVQKLLEDVK